MVYAKLWVQYGVQRRVVTLLADSVEALNDHKRELESKPYVCILDETVDENYGPIFVLPNNY